MADDIEVARKLQEELNYQQQLSFSDAELASRLVKDTNVVDRVLNDRDHAHQLYDGLTEVPDDNDLLVQQLQSEERYMMNEDDDTKLSTMMIYDRSEIHQREEREKMDQIEKDEEIAAKMQIEETGYDTGEDPGMPILEPYEERPPLAYFQHRSPPKEDTPSPPKRDTPPLDQGIPCDSCGEVVDFDQYQNHLVS